jgi:hypothetical protein
MCLYTFICEYAGGTYIAQVKAGSPKKALIRWLDEDALSQISLKTRSQIRKSLMADSPVAIAGCRNVWCCSASTSKGLFLVNVVKMSS